MATNSLLEVLVHCAAPLIGSYNSFSGYCVPKGHETGQMIVRLVARALKGQWPVIAELETSSIAGKLEGYGYQHEPTSGWSTELYQVSEFYSLNAMLNTAKA
jgi:hypothetical protein